MQSARCQCATSKKVRKHGFRGHGTKPAPPEGNNGIRVDGGGPLMMDLLFLLVVVGFFAGAIACVEGCERL
jgi:hypothetical protein